MQVVVSIQSNHFSRIAAQLPGVARQLAMETALKIEAEVKTGMAAAKSGEIYDNHQASAPGEMPAIDPGNLANSITSEYDGPTGAVVYTNVGYAPDLEYGTVHMEARPFFTPAAEEVRPFFEGVARVIGERLR